MTQGDYFTPNSDSTLIPSGGSPGEVITNVWRPGDAGPTERVAMGDGRGEGWIVYFLERWLIVELWSGGEWQLTRALDCTPLLEVSGLGLRHMVAFGWDKFSGTLSLGCVSRTAFDARSVHKNFPVRNLGLVFAPPLEIEVGGAMVSGGGQTTWRSLDAKVSTVAGRLYNRNPLTKGELARLAGREKRYA